MSICNCIFIVYIYVILVYLKIPNSWNHFTSNLTELTILVFERKRSNGAYNISRVVDYISDSLNGLIVNVLLQSTRLSGLRLCNKLKGKALLFNYIQTTQLVAISVHFFYAGIGYPLYISDVDRRNVEVGVLERFELRSLFFKMYYYWSSFGSNNFPIFICYANTMNLIVLTNFLCSSFWILRASCSWFRLKC